MRLFLFTLPLLAATCTLRSEMPVDTGIVTSAPKSHTEDLEIPAYGEDEDIVRHIGYTASYNHTTLCPNWVAWELTAAEVEGACEGKYSFSRDPDVSDPKATREDYRNTGWDKGHMAPRADMKWSEQALEESYYFTNICPQSHTMNSSAWRKIEELTRRVATRYGAVSVVCGPIYTDHSHGNIGQGVQVPDLFFKALAVESSEGMQTVAFIVENGNQTLSPKRYSISVDSVESIIGRDLFPSLPEEVESTVNWNIWNY